MSITRLQQARQMYATGQRVAKTLDGSRPGYRGSDMATVAGETTAANTSAKNTSGADYGGGNQGGGGSGSDGQGNDYSTMTGDDIRKARREYEIGVGGGLAKDQVVGPYGPYKPNTYQPFLDYRPKINIPNFGLSGMFLNFFKKPIQKFSDFGSKKNRNYFMDDVVRAGKIPGLNYGTVSEMTSDELEKAYKSYLSNRLSGETDAYGNPIGGGGNDSSGGIMDIYNIVNATDTDTDTDTEKFVSRFLQNRTPEERAEIEEQYQNYYT